MFFAYLLLALVILLYILRAEGDETIPFGATLEINDGAADAFQAVAKIESLGFPNETTGVVESKTLDLPEAVLRKLPTLKDGGSFTVKIQVTAAIRTRIETIRKARTTKKWRFSVPIDVGTIAATVNGFVTGAPLEDLEPDKINVMNVSVTVTGPHDP